MVQLLLKEAMCFMLILTRDLCMTVLMTFLIVALTWPIGSPSFCVKLPFDFAVMTFNGPLS